MSTAEIAHALGYGRFDAKNGEFGFRPITSIALRLGSLRRKGLVESMIRIDTLPSGLDAAVRVWRYVPKARRA